MANPNASVETLAPGPNSNDVACITPAPVERQAFCQASGLLAIREGTTVIGNIGNSGEGGQTQVQSDVHVDGSILSVPTIIFSPPFASVTQDVISGSSFVGASPEMLMVGGMALENQKITLSPVPPLVPFPTTTQGSQPSDEMPVPPTGTDNFYTSLTVRPGTTTTLESGIYLIDALLVEGTLATAPGTRIYVRALSISADASFGSSPAFLAYEGTGSFSIDFEFQGTFVAPNAMVSLESDLFVGSVYAENLIVGFRSTVQCVSQTQIGSESP